MPSPEMFEKACRFLDMAGCDCVTADTLTALLNSVREEAIEESARRIEPADSAVPEFKNALSVAQALIRVLASPQKKP